MTRQTATTIENNFKRGRISEATGLNYPENACTDEADCIFHLDGTVTRRPGFDLEDKFLARTLDRVGYAVTSTIWRNVGGDGSQTLLVMQVGPLLTFYQIGSTSISSGSLTPTINLVNFIVPGVNEFTAYAAECQYTVSNEHLIVAHPYCDPFYISYDSTTQTVSGMKITIKIRDLEGDSNDPYATAERPTANYSGLDSRHLYNLYNQGWSANNLTTWDNGRTDMPSNSDVMWTFKNADETFDLLQIPKIFRGNSPAPRGHFILDLFDQNRNIMPTIDPYAASTATGGQSGGSASKLRPNKHVTQLTSLPALSGTTSLSTGYIRPSTCSFYAGRIFYSGISYPGFSSRIYFTQIIESADEYSFCYQQNDPTSEDLFDLGPADGGFINIPEAGTVVKLVTIANGLLVFSNNGVWIITGSVGSGFQATDYTVQRVSSVRATTASSFVDVGGLPAWMNADGVYMVQAQQGGGVGVTSLTLQTLLSYFDTFPVSAKEQAKGYFNHNLGIIQWLIRSTDAPTVDDKYNFDTILNYNVTTGAWYTWKVPNTLVNVNGITLWYGTDEQYVPNNVVDQSANLVVDHLGNQVIANNYVLQTTPTNTQVFKYIVSAWLGAWNFSFAEARDYNYTDWVSLAPTSYTSHFTSGYKVHGQGNKRFQPAYMTMFSKTLDNTQYLFQGSWDYSNNSATHRWSISQTITHNNAAYDYASAKIKVRGHGRALQFRISSVPNLPFHVIGWVGWEMINQLP